MTELTLQTALTRAALTRPPSALSAALTLGRRALLKVKHVPFQPFDVTVFPTMTTAVFAPIAMRMYDKAR